MGRWGGLRSTGAHFGRARRAHIETRDFTENSSSSPPFYPKSIALESLSHDLTT